MRGSSQFLLGGLVMIAVGFTLYIGLVLLQAAGILGSLAFGIASGIPGLFVLVAAFFFVHAWSMRKSERMMSSGTPLSPPIR